MAGNAWNSRWYFAPSLRSGACTDVARIFIFAFSISESKEFNLDRWRDTMKVSYPMAIHSATATGSTTASGAAASWLLTGLCTKSIRTVTTAASIVDA